MKKPLLKSLREFLVNELTEDGKALIVMPADYESDGLYLLDCRLVYLLMHLIGRSLSFEDFDEMMGQIIIEMAIEKGFLE